MTLEQRLSNIEKNQERQTALLHKLLGNVPDQVKGWGAYEEAAKILKRSRSWYKKVRNGHAYPNGNKTQTLIENKDWRKIGNDIEYYLPAIQELKENIIKNKKSPLTQ
jgi:hypothetical protein